MLKCLRTKFITNVIKYAKKGTNIFAMKIASNGTEKCESLLDVFTAICGLALPFMVLYGLYGLF